MTSRRAFLSAWAVMEGYVMYPLPMPEQFLPIARGPFAIRPMTMVMLPGRVYTMRSVRLG